MEEYDFSGARGLIKFFELKLVLFDMVFFSGLPDLKYNVLVQLGSKSDIVYKLNTKQIS
jgi:hypothetical protein